MDTFFPGTSEHSNLDNDFDKEDSRKKYESTSNVETSDTNGFEPSFQILKEVNNVCPSVSGDDQNRKEREEFSGTSTTSNEPAKPTSRRGRKPSNVKNRAHNNNQNRGLQSSPVIKDSSSRRNANRRSGGGFALPERQNIDKDFIEPALAEPKPIYTGLSLESFPSAKIKKESLWPSRNPDRRPGRSSNSSNETKEGMTVSENDEETKHIEEKYKTNLQTEVFDHIVSDSSTRNSVNAKPTKGRPGRPPSKNTLKTPKQTKHTLSNENSNLRSSKRIKVISPRKPGSTNLAPGSKEQALWGSNDEQTQSNDDFCSACGGSGVFICCDTCPKSYHFLCCEPPLEDCPDDNWNCPECVHRRNPHETKKWDDIGIFGKLLNQQESRGVKEFQLPKNLRDHTFVGVSTGEGGVYQDDTVKPIPPSNKNDAQVPGFNTNVDLEIDSLYDKEGKPYLCHKCGLSGLNRRTIIRCDYCPLAWHLDCLDYPLTTAKSIGNKWRCPNHYEELLSRQLMNRRDFKDANVVDVSLQNKFFKIAALGKLLIKETGQPYLKENDDSPFTLREYLHKRKEHLGISSLHTYNTKEKGEEDTKNESKIAYVPSYLQNYSNEHGVIAKASNRLSRIITLTDVDDENDGKSKAFIYRIPEKLVLLDFISKATETRSQNDKSSITQDNSISTGGAKGHSIKKNILDSVEEYKARGRLDHNREDRDFVEGLTKLNHIPTEKPQPSLSHLINAIMAFNKSENKTHHTIDDGELDDLRSIKRLIEVKGRESLLQYLNS